MPTVHSARVKIVLGVVLLAGVGYGGFYLYSNSTGTLFANARDAYSAQDRDTARDLLNRILSKEPNHLDALLLLARINFESKSLPTTVQDLNRILALDQKNLDARRLLIQVLLAQCRFKEVEAQIELLETVTPATVEEKGYLALAVAGRTVGATQPEEDFKRAEELLAEIAAQDPTRSEPHLASAVLLLEKGEYEKTVPEIQLAQRTMGDQFSFLWTQGKANFFMGDLEASIQALDRADQLRKTGQGVAPPAPWLMELYLYQGLAFIEMGQFEEAERRLNIAVENLPSAIEPTLATVNLNLIQAFTESLDPEAVAESQRLYRLAADVLSRRKDILGTSEVLRFQLALIRLYLQSYQEGLTLLEGLAEVEPPYLQALHELGNLYYEQASYGKAASIYRRILNYDPGNPTSHYNLATILIRNREVEQAREHLTKVVASEPEKIDARLNLGLAARLSGLFADAEKEYKSILGSLPNNMDALIGLGLISSARGVSGEAKDYFNRARDENPTRSEPYYYLGQIALEEGRDAEAQAMFEQCLSRNPDNEFASLAMIEIDFRKGLWTQGRDRLKALIENPNTRMKVVVSNALALAELMSGDLEEADKRIKSLEEILSGLGPELVAAVRTNQAFRETKREDPQKALELYQAAVDALPQDPTTYYNLGTAQLQAGQYSEAILSFRRAQEFDATDEAIRYNLAVAQASVNQWGEAQKILGELAQGEEAPVEVVRNLAEAYIGGNDPQAALTLLEPSIERRPGVVELKVLRVKAFIAAGDYAKASEAASDLLKNYPQDWSVQMVSGIAAFHSGDIQAAETSLRRAQQINETEPNIKLNLATQLIAKGDYEGFDEAERLLEEIEPTVLGGSPDFFNQKAILAFHRSDYPESRKFLQRSLLENGTQPEIQALFNKIEGL